MKIIFETGEQLPTHIPDGTVVIEKKDETIIRKFEIRDNRFILVEDFAEKDRDWRKGEKEEFERTSDFSPEAIIKFFLYNDGSIPYREYKVYSSKESEVFKNLSHYGLNTFSEKKGRYFGMFSIRLHEDEDISNVLNELKIFLKIAQEELDDPIMVDITEESLGDSGVYYLHIYRSCSRYTAKITKTTYGMKRDIKEFNSLEDSLIYISKHLYYND